MTEETDKEKAAYAALLLQCQDDAFKAALLLYPNDTGKALRISNEWPVDALVIAERARLAKDPNAFLPTKADLAREIWSIVKDERGQKNVAFAIAARDRIAAGKLYAEIMGYVGPIEEPEDENDKQNIPVYKVVNE